MSNEIRNGNTIDRDFSDHDHLDSDHDKDNALKRIRTAGSISISPELFEKIYLSPQNQVKGDLRKTLGNPTPVALVGFLMALTPLSMDLMNWRGAQAGDGSASIGTYFFCGGMLLLAGAIGEFILGNTFPMVVFASFSGFWFTFGATLQPFYSAYGNYAALSPNGNGLDSPEFNNAFGFFLVMMGLLCLVYLVCALRTNLIFVSIFFTLVFAFSFLTAAFFNLADGNASRATSYIIAGGAFAFVTSMLGWYLLFAILLISLDFPFALPVFDLSTVVKGKSDRMNKSKV